MANHWVWGHGIAIQLYPHRNVCARWLKMAPLPPSGTIHQVIRGIRIRPQAFSKTKYWVLPVVSLRNNSFRWIEAPKWSMKDGYSGTLTGTSFCCCCCSFSKSSNLDTSSKFSRTSAFAAARSFVRSLGFAKEELQDGLHFRLLHYYFIISTERKLISDFTPNLDRSFKATAAAWKRRTTHDFSSWEKKNWKVLDFFKALEFFSR